MKKVIHPYKGNEYISTNPRDNNRRIEVLSIVRRPFGKTTMRYARCRNMKTGKITLIRFDQFQRRWKSHLLLGQVTNLNCRHLKIHIGKHGSECSKCQAWV